MRREIHEIPHHLAGGQLLSPQPIHGRLHERDELIIR